MFPPRTELREVYREEDPSGGVAWTEDTEGVAITVIVFAMLAGMLLVYLLLFCHAWGLHLRLVDLLRGGERGVPGERGTFVDRNNGAGRVSLPNIQVSSPVTRQGSVTQNRLTTPPPCYTDVKEKGSPPSYTVAKNFVVKESAYCISEYRVTIETEENGVDFNSPDYCETKNKMAADTSVTDSAVTVKVNHPESSLSPWLPATRQSERCFVTTLNAPQMPSKFWQSNLQVKSVHRVRSVQVDCLSENRDVLLSCRMVQSYHLINSEGTTPANDILSTIFSFPYLSPDHLM